MLKKEIAKFLIRRQLKRLQADSVPMNRLLGKAALLQFRQLSEEEFRGYLDNFYAGLDADACKREIDLTGKAQRLDRALGYKTDVMGLQSDASGRLPHGRLDFWARRFALLRHLGIRSDVLIVRAGEQIPPHGHSQVVSGFYVLQGQIAIRHYDRIRELPEHVVLRKVVDTVLGPGGYTTNSEYHHNIHWLLGVAPVSYLFRFTVTDVPVQRFSSGQHRGSRIYVDPTAPPDDSGLIRAPYITEKEAKRVTFA